MGYREIIPPERLQEFEELGESEVQVRLDAGLYSGNHKEFAILFIKLCESERESDEQAPETVVRAYETWLEQIILGVLIAVIAAAVLFWLGLI